ncbi:MAG TPA: cyclic nucleotide-binding domain-containing protein [Myxococcota bacterium]|nr:cyclic nucleotide-binding domain-containing protein [Myxococcota bacterium]
MSEKLIDIYRKAENDLLEKKFDQALAAFATVVKHAPDHLWSRFQIARTLGLMKENNRSYDVYFSLAMHCLKAGFPLIGMIAAKKASLLQTNIDEVLEMVTEIYSLESDRIDQNMAMPAISELAEDATAGDPVLIDDKLSLTAVQLAKTFSEPRYPRSLPPVPLLSLLSKEAVFPILELLEARNYQPGEAIVVEGDPCTSIYFLAHGEVEVHEGQDKSARTLARLASGSVFGEMALITDGPRLASAVAVRESDILTLPLPELEAIAEDLDDITWAVAKFTRQRFLNNLLVTSPVFAPFNSFQRKDTLDRFTSVGVPTNDVIIREGEPGQGLYLILGGEVSVAKFEGGSLVHLASLREGAVFGEISLVRDTPTTATVKATRGGEFLFLSRDDFQELVAEHPEIKEALSSLSNERLDEQRQALTSAAMVSEDGAIIF